MGRTASAMSCLLLTAALVGCGSADAGDSGSPEKSAKSSEPKMAGIVMVDTAVTKGGVPEPSSEGTWEVRVFDPESGDSVNSLTLPTEEADGVESSKDVRHLFSADMQYAALPTEDGAIVLHRADQESHQYVPTTTLNPPNASYSGGDVQYENPQFSGDGERLLFEADPSEGQTKVMSVDYRDPGEPAEEAELKPSEGSEGTGWKALPDGISQRVPSSSETITLHGSDGEPAETIKSKDATVSYVYADDQLADGHLITESDDGSMTNYLHIGTIDDNTMLMRAEQMGMVGTDWVDRYGRTIRVEIAPESKDLTITPVGKDGADEIEAAAVDPTGERILLVTDGGWFVQDNDSKTPEPLRKPPGGDGAADAAENDGDAYAWIE